MAVILTQHDLPNLWRNATWNYWAYNALDCCLTREVYDVLKPRLEADPDALRCYNFERAIQAPAMVMMQRGVLIDDAARLVALTQLEKDEADATTKLQTMATPYWDSKVRRKDKCGNGKRHLWPRNVDDTDAVCKRCGLHRLIADGPNPRSPLQIKKLLYGNMQLPEQREHKTHKVSVDDECINKLMRKCPEHYELLSAIVECRRVRKQIGLLNSTADGDGRWRASFNVGATEVDRWSSSKNPFGTGTNFQNIADRSRHIFVADPGMMLFYADLSQAESRVIAYDAEDEAYIQAHESDYDVHTFVARQCWPELPWTGDPIEDKKLAEQATSFDPHHDYRLYSKKVQHGGNIGMSFHGVARELHIAEAIAKSVIEKLDTAFPRRKARQRELIAELERTGAIKTFLGRRRQFMGRLRDSGTHREALAQTQQSTISWLLGCAIWRVWWELDKSTHVTCNPKPSDPNICFILAQIHDALLGECRDGDLDTLREIKRLIEIPIPIRGRIMRIPVDIHYGPTWRHSDMKKLEE